jgi:hypothetical protein
MAGEHHRGKGRFLRYINIISLFIDILENITHRNGVLTSQLVLPLPLVLL